MHPGPRIRRACPPNHSLVIGEPTSITLFCNNLPIFYYTLRWTRLRRFLAMCSISIYCANIRMAIELNFPPPFLFSTTPWPRWNSKEITLILIRTENVRVTNVRKTLFRGGSASDAAPWKKKSPSEANKAAQTLLHHWTRRQWRLANGTIFLSFSSERASKWYEYIHGLFLFERSLLSSLAWAKRLTMNLHGMSNKYGITKKIGCTRYRQKQMARR